MDDSNGDNGNAGPRHDPNQHAPKRDMVYLENMRQRIADVNRTRLIISAIAQPYIEPSKASIISELGTDEYNYPQRFFARKEDVLKRAIGVASAIAGVNNAPLEQPQVQCVAENVEKNASSAMVNELGLFALTTVLAARQWQKPPVWAARSPLLRSAWPLTAFVMYMIPVRFVAKPIVYGAVSARHANQFLHDPRMSGLDTDIEGAVRKLSQNPEWRSKHPEIFSENPSSAVREDRVSSVSWDSASPSAQIEDQGSSWQTSTASSWSTPAPTQTQEQTPNAAWEDDASPMAASHRQTETPGSAWDRVRQRAGQTGESRSQQPIQAQTRRAWDERPYQKGSTDPSVEMERGNTSKDQAQRDFDKLLDQERQGSDEENKRWK